MLTAEPGANLCMRKESAMKDQTATPSPSKQTQGVEEPMVMGMAKKMMRQTGRHDNPGKMTRKAACGMSEAEGHPHGGGMMDMSRRSEMLEAIHHTNALAVHATGELQQAFADWLKELEDKAIALLAKGTADAAQLARSLKVTEASALYLLYRLAASGKITVVGKLRNPPSAPAPSAKRDQT
jgi:hypothetical protein